MKLVCLGDSLTYGFKVSRSQAWPALVGQRLNIEVINKGICGDSTSGMLSRFYRDVVEQKATHMIIMGGGNDFIWDVPLSIVKSNISTIVQQAFYYGVFPIIGIPTPIETNMVEKFWPVVRNSFKVNRELAQYREWIYDFASHFQCKVVDFYKLFFDFNLGIPMAELYLDGLHPTVEGNRVLAEAVGL